MACFGLYCGKTLLFKNSSAEIYGECGACPRGQRTNEEKYCQPCTESPELYDWLYLGFMAMLPLVSHWFCIEWDSKKRCSGGVLFQQASALFECSMAAIVTLLVSNPPGTLSIYSCGVLMLSDWYTMLYNPSPDYITTLHCTQEAVYPLYTIVFVYYAFCLVFMMLLRPFLMKKIQCSLYMPNPFFESIYTALYFFPVLTMLQAVAGGLLYYAFPYIILVASLANLAVYLVFAKIEIFSDLIRTDRLLVLFSHWFLHGYGLIALSREDQLEQNLSFLILVPLPLLFYLFTTKFTKPSRIISEGAKWY
ncbi:JNK1/MAPK8-associated membrane protein-like [Onychomys torridus]|uniref:JNK1/MAPK8-associated membrane protein-like n=1 Tax=Onychomys torridus TaxID=38674 RepID=UPI00167F62FF|nr:JNK1/MAPK8-associated membrane protein-like [Onychomys torridus]